MPTPTPLPRMPTPTLTVLPSGVSAVAMVSTGVVCQAPHVSRNTNGTRSVLQPAPVAGHATRVVLYARCCVVHKASTEERSRRAPAAMGQLDSGDCIESYFDRLYVLLVCLRPQLYRNNELLRTLRK